MPFALERLASGRHIGFALTPLENCHAHYASCHAGAN
jgi:hypothetical protein